MIEHRKGAIVTNYGAANKWIRSEAAWAVRAYFVPLTSALRSWRKGGSYLAELRSAYRHLGVL